MGAREGDAGDFVAYAVNRNVLAVGVNGHPVDIIIRIGTGDEGGGFTGLLVFTAGMLGDLRGNTGRLCNRRNEPAGGRRVKRAADQCIAAAAENRLGITGIIGIPLTADYRGRVDIGTPIVRKEQRLICRKGRDPEAPCENQYEKN